MRFLEHSSDLRPKQIKWIRVNQGPGTGSGTQIPSWRCDWRSEKSVAPSSEPRIEPGSLPRDGRVQNCADSSGHLGAEQVTTRLTCSDPSAHASAGRHLRFPLCKKYAKSFPAGATSSRATQPRNSASSLFLSYSSSQFDLPTLMYMYAVVCGVPNVYEQSQLLVLT